MKSLSEGVIDLNFKGHKDAVDLIKYIFKVNKRAGVSMVDIFYQDEVMYICSEGYETDMMSMYKLDFKELGKGRLEVSEEVGDFDLTDYLVEDIEEDENLSPIIETPMLSFGTTLNFLECIILYDECRVIVTENEIEVFSVYSKILLPKFKSLTLSDYIDQIGVDTISIWEKVNVKNIKLLTNIVNRTKKIPAGMYVALEGNSIYSDNKDVVFEAPSWHVKGNYTFTYVMIEALKQLPDTVEVKVAKKDGKIILNVGEVYLAWSNNIELESENIMSFLDLKTFQNVISIPVKELGKLTTLNANSINQEENYMKLQVISQGLVKASVGDNYVLLIAEGLVGSILVLEDADKFINLLKASGSPKPIISVDPEMELPTAMISGSINILTSLEHFEIDPSIEVQLGVD